jgi:hypothetical protein
MSFVGLRSPELLRIRNEDGTFITGGSQYWYPPEGFIPQGACGATAASNILAYMLMTRKPLHDAAGVTGLIGQTMPEGLAISEGLAWKEHSPVSKQDFLEFMKKVYQFLYPHVGGLMADGFEAGISELAKEYKLPIETECLKITINRNIRPAFKDAIAFIKTSLKTDIPVAFLILSKGNVSVLDTWHWVTILGFEEESGRIQIVDNGKVFFAELRPWLDTSIMGGAFVRVLTIPAVSCHR